MARRSLFGYRILFVPLAGQGTWWSRGKSNFNRLSASLLIADSVLPLAPLKPGIESKSGEAAEVEGLVKRCAGNRHGSSRTPTPTP